MKKLSGSLGLLLPRSGCFFVRRRGAHHQLPLQENGAGGELRMANATEHGVNAGNAKVAAWLADCGQRRGKERRESRVIESSKKHVARHFAPKPSCRLHKPGGILVV